MLAVSREQFLVFASNAFAILGLRSLFFLLSGLSGRFRYLNVGLGVILAYVGLKMLAVGRPLELHPPTWLSLVVIAVVLTVAITASVLADRRDPPPAAGPGEPPADAAAVGGGATGDDVPAGPAQT